MKRTAFIISMLAALGLAGSAFAVEAVPNTCGGGQTVSAEETLQIFKGNVDAMKTKSKPSDLPTVFIDPRTVADYQKAHIPGSINIPIEEGLFTQESFSKAAGTGAKPVLFYCNGENCPRSHAACEKAMEFGYQGKIYYFYTGMGPNGWPRINGPTVSGAEPYPGAS